MNRSPRRTRLTAGLIALFVAAAVWTGAVRADEGTKHDIQIATADDSETTKRIVESLLKRFPGAPVLDSAQALPATKKRPLYIAVGPSALRTLVSDNPDGVIVSVFTSSQAYRSIIESVSEPRRSAVTAVYAEPSPIDQLRLIALLYKRRINVAVLLSDKNAYLLPVLREGASQSAVELTIEHFSLEDNLNRILNRVASAQVLLALPDSNIFNPETIRNVLLMTYRRNQAVVGFSAALVRAGALASTYSSIDDTLAQVEELIRNFENSGQLPAPEFPRYFRVAINDSVARSLNLVVDESVKAFSRAPRERQR